MKRTPAEMSSSEKIYGILSKRSSRRLTATAFPKRESQLEQRFSTSAWSWRSTSRASVIWRTAWMVSTSASSSTRTECSGLTAMSLASRCIISSEQTGTMGQMYSYAAFFSYPIIMYFTAGVAGVFSAPHQRWKAWCKPRKKKVLVHGLLQSASPLGGELSWRARLQFFIAR